MGVFDDYINNLEGQTEVDPQTIAKDLLKIHNDELSIREAKITKLDGEIVQRDDTINTLRSEVTTVKARNYELIDYTPNTADTAINQSDNDGEKPNGVSIKIADLFNQKVRDRHGF